MSKFRPVTFYNTKATSGYKLLPFRFSELDEDRYLITNQAGQYHLVNKPDVRRIVEKTLASSESLYLDLKSKHFIFDDVSDVAIDLLALKTRTKLSGLDGFTDLHMIVVTLRCEHSCPYCQVSRQTEDKSLFDMSEETADKVLDFIFSSPSPEIKIEFQGGEPLLHFGMVRYIVMEAKRRNLTEQRALEFVIATNLAPVTDEILEFCADHNILISTSLDGPRDLHNKNRPRAGKNSYELAVRGIERAREVLGRDRVSALMTTSEASLSRVRDIIDEYVRLEFDGVFLRALSPYGFAARSGWYSSYSIGEWLRFYEDGLDYILGLNQKGVFFVEQYAAILLTKMLTPFDTKFVDLMNPSGAGIAGVIYNYDGDVYPSDESRMLAEMGDRALRMGNVNYSTYEEVFANDTLLDALDESFTLSAPMCTDCAFEPYCGADPIHHHRMQGDFTGHKPTSDFCSKNMGVMKILIRKLEESRETRRILSAWVAR